MRAAVVCSLMVVLLACAMLMVSAQKGGGSCEFNGNSFECPSYTYTQLTPSVQLRTYNAFTIAGVEEIGDDDFLGTAERSLPLLGRYWGGYNSANVTIAPTLPIAAQVTPIDEDYVEVITVLFLPTALASNPPTPNNIGVYTKPLAAGFPVAARNFTFGRLDTPAVFREVIELARILTEQKVSFDNTSFFFADYSPEENGRKNGEVWLFTTSSESQAAPQFKTAKPRHAKTVFSA